jgi:ankyrin repeat protein
MASLIKHTVSALVLVLLATCAQGQMVKMLEYGDTTFAYMDPDFELLDAASQGDTIKLKAFLELGTNVDTQTWDGVTPLMFAAQNGHLRTVELLIDAGADVNLKPYNQIDALLGASIAGHVLVTDTLILNGANVNTRSLDGVTPLMYAAAYDHYLLCDVLIFYGARLDAVDNFRNSPLHFSAFYGNLEISQLLVEKGAEVDAVDYNGFTPLMCAAQNGHLQVVDFLVLAGADVNKTNDENCTPLSLAIMNRFYGIVDYLLTSGADPDHAISEKVNQYELAREMGGKEMTTLLAGYGAAPLRNININKMNINLELNWNNSDMMIGGSVGLVESVRGLEAEAGYLIRPMVRSVRYDIDDQIQYQYWERRSVIYLGAGKKFVLASPRAKEYFGAVVSANAGYTYGSFRGANQRPEDKIVFLPRAGIFYNFNVLNIRLGYEYFNIPKSSISPHRFTLTVGVTLNLVKTGFKLKKEPRL